MISVARFLSAALFISLLAGCQGYVTERDKFWQVISTTYEGEVVAEWIAVGQPKKIEGGVRILAIAKSAPGPYPYEARYVIGRRVDVLGANVDYFRTAPPAWLRDQTIVTTQDRVTTVYAK